MVQTVCIVFQIDVMPRPTRQTVADSSGFLEGVDLILRVWDVVSLR